MFLFVHVSAQILQIRSERSFCPPNFHSSKSLARNCIVLFDKLSGRGEKELPGGRRWENWMGWGGRGWVGSGMHEEEGSIKGSHNGSNNSEDLNEIVLLAGF